MEGGAIVKIYAKATELNIARIKKGFEWNVLACQVGISKSILFKIRKGASTSPATAQKICVALGVSFDDVFCLK
jgi:DNA-binding Xre family transcriptional regulator